MERPFISKWIRAAGPMGVFLIGAGLLTAGEPGGGHRTWLPWRIFREAPPAPSCPAPPLVAPAPLAPETKLPDLSKKETKVEPKQTDMPPPPADTLAFDSPASGAGFSDVASVGRVPTMFGDLPGGPIQSIYINSLGQAILTHPHLGGSRLNLAENGSPIVQDRIYFRYNFFQNNTETAVAGPGQPLSFNQFNQNQFTFGLEKTFLNGMGSVEVRVPFSSQLNADQWVTGTGVGVPQGPGDYGLEFNNLAVILKAHILSTDSFYFSGGLGINIPTGRDVTFRTSLTNPTYPIDPSSTANLTQNYFGTVSNDTVNLLPYLAFAFAPGDRFFVQGFWQYDIPVNSSSVAVQGNGVVNSIDGTPIRDVIPFPNLNGNLFQQQVMRFNLGAGYWIIRDRSRRFLTGLAPTVEVHYTTTVTDARNLQSQYVDFPFDSSITVGNQNGNTDTFNLTLGTTMEFWNRLNVGTGFVVPLSSESNRPFDFEFILMMNYRF